MFANALVLAAALYGVDVGWQPTDDGQLEYIIQVEPELLEVMRGGEAITSAIPPELQGVRRYRIVVGNAQLPRTDLPSVQEEADAVERPRSFEPVAESKSIRQATGEEAETSAAGDDVAPSGESDAAERLKPAAVVAPKPWMPLILTLIGLFASIGGNVYFLWLTFDTRKRYRMLVRDLAPGS